MKILHISYSLSEQSAAYRLAYAQVVHQGHEINFLVGRKSSSDFINSRRIAPFISGLMGFGAHIIDYIASVLFLKTDEVFSLGIGLPLKNYLFEKIIIDAKPDVVHVHWGGYGFFPLSILQRISERRNMKVVVTTHDYHYFTGGCHVPMDCTEFSNNCNQCPMARGIVAKKWIGSTRRHSTMLLSNSNISFVSPSTYTASIIKASVQGVNPVVIPNTAGDVYYNEMNSLEEYISLYKRYKEMNNHIPTLIMVGVKVSARQNKGVDVLIELVKKMTAQGMQFNLITVGEYPKLEVAGTHLHHSSQSVEQMKKLYAVADLCIVPSRYETFSQVTLESIQMATPVVAFDLTGPADIITNGVSGFLVRSFDIDQFGDVAIRNLTFKHQHLELIKNSALEVNERFSPAKIADLYTKLYKETNPSSDK